MADRTKIEASERARSTDAPSRETYSDILAEQMRVQLEGQPEPIARWVRSRIKEGHYAMLAGWESELRDKLADQGYDDLIDVVEKALGYGAVIQLYAITVDWIREGRP